MAPVELEAVTFAGEMVFVELALPVCERVVTPFGSGELTVTT